MKNKDIAQIININDPCKVTKTENGNFIGQYTDNIIAHRVEKIDNFYIEQLYKAYKDTDVTKVFLIDIENFERFLKRYLPIYLKEVKNNDK